MLQLPIQRAFYANAGASQARNLATERRFKLLDRAVQPHLDFHAPMWPPQPQLAKNINRLQRKMTSIIQRLPRELDETDRQYIQRRNKQAATTCRERGPWAARWFQKVLDWNQHVTSERSASWIKPILEFRDSEWFIQRRLQMGSASVLGGATNTRAQRGHVYQRWSQGVNYAVCALTQR